MAYYIPFINSPDDWSLARDLYPDSAAYRVTMRSHAGVRWNPSPQWKLWVDTEVDALHCWPKSGNLEFNNYFGPFADARKVAEPTFWSKPDRAVTSNFVNAILDNVIDKNCDASWLSVPQLPLVDGSARNKINRALAESTLQWKSRRGFKGQLILPVIFTNQSQLNGKTERNGKVSLVISCLEASGADGLWVVDSSLGDQDGTGSFAKRFRGIINLHEELNGKLGSRTVIIAGPYWGLNLVLWARRSSQFAAIGVGRGYQYYVPGAAMPKAANPRLVLAPVRRQAVWSAELKSWIRDALPKIPKGDPAHISLMDLLSRFDLLHDRKQARKQVARFYKEWLKKFEVIPVEGRALALYQDFSSAYVLGKTLKPIPDRVRSPSRIAEQFMMVCL